jgi:hypothetical protein
LAVLGQPQPVHKVTQPRNSHLHRRPRMLTLGPSAWAMAHCTLISRSIQKHDDRLGGRPAANSMPRPRGCGTKPTHPGATTLWQSLRCHLTPPGTMQDATAHQVGDAPGRKPPSCALSFVCQKGLCVLCRPSPHCGVGCGACWAQLFSMVVFECFGQRQWTPRMQP